MFITQQDRDNYTKLCSLYQSLHLSMSKIKEVVNDRQVYTILYQAAKRLVGRKDVLWLDSNGEVQPKEHATIKLSFTGFMKRDRWGRSWKRVGEHDMWSYVFKPALVAGLEKLTTKRNPEAYRDLVSIVKDGIKLREAYDKELCVSTKLDLPLEVEIQAGLSESATYDSIYPKIIVCAFELLSTVSWSTTIKLRCTTPDGSCHVMEYFARSDQFVRFSEGAIVDALCIMLQDAKKKVDEAYTERHQPQLDFNQKYGQYLVANEL